MSISLRDQLLKAGLVNEKQAKQAGKEKQKQQRLAHKGQIELDDTQPRARQDRFRQQEAVGDDHGHVGAKRAEGFDIGGVPEIDRCPDRNAERFRRAMHG